MTQIEMSQKWEEVAGIAAEQSLTNESDATGQVQPKVHFSLLSAIGVQYSVTGAPIAIGTYLSLTIGLGGSPAYFWGFVFTGFFQLAVCLTMAELASAMPHSSGK
jgi:amino acid transporter